MDDSEMKKNKDHYDNFISSRKNIILSSIDEEGKPFISYAPFVQQEGDFYIFISKIADHYRYIEKSQHVHALLIADEATTANKFKTERARWLCTVDKMENGSELIFSLFNKQHGEKIMQVLRSLDFTLFQLTPIKGRYVRDFGLAFDLKGHWLTPVQPGGHNPRVKPR